MTFENIHVDIRKQPEFSSLEDFVDELENEERTEFTGQELQKLTKGIWQATGDTFFYQDVRDALLDMGFTLRERPISRRVRTFSTNNHDRWYGRGSCKTHGGSGSDQISGFAGHRG